MAEAAIVSWTPANWLTIVLMVLLAYVIVGALARMWQQSQAGGGGLAKAA